jgi:tripartite-type tricarboxylate transporter receptor subunit TctC
MEGAQMRKAASRLLIAILTTAPLGVPAAAQDWPTRQTNFVIGLGPGSGLDLFARVIADALQTRLGSPVVMDYRVGAAGNIAAEYLARAAPDGSVIGGMIAAPIVTNRMFMKLNIDPMQDLAPVTVLGTIPSVVIVSKKNGAKSMAEFIDKLKKDPGKYNFSSVGIGTTGHLSIELIALKSGTKMVHVPYKSTPEALQAVMTGEVDMATLTVNLAEQAILTDRVTGIAITSARRWPSLPNVPTIAEAGVPEMPVDAWFGVFVPAKTPPAIIDKIANEVRAVENIPEVRKRIEGTYYRPVANTPAEFAELLRHEQIAWKRVVDALGLKPPQ